MGPPQDPTSTVACLIRYQGSDPRTAEAFDGGTTPVSLFFETRTIPIIFLQRRGGTHEQNHSSGEYTDYERWHLCEDAIDDVIEATHNGMINQNDPIYDHIVGLNLAMKVAAEYMRVHK